MRRASLVIGVVVLAAASWTAVAGMARISSLEKDVRTLQDRVRRLSYNTASGGGVNLKMMPDPKTGAPTVPLEEVFSFDRNHALCRVDSNPQAFTLPTYTRGNLVVQPHRFFMSMTATSIDQFEASTRPDGKRQVTMRGGLSCATEIGQATVTLGHAPRPNTRTTSSRRWTAGSEGGERVTRLFLRFSLTPTKRR